MPGSEKNNNLFEYQKLGEASLDGFWVVNLQDGRILHANKIFCDMLGYTREALLSMCIDELEVFGSRAMEAGRGEVGFRHKLGHVVRLEVGVSVADGLHFAFVRDITKNTRTEDTLYFIAQRGWMNGADGFLKSLAQYLGQTLGVDYVVIDRLGASSDIAQTVALYAKGEIAPNLSYVLKGTPCENVMGREFCFYPQGIQTQFPDDALLNQMGAESYAGIPLWDSAGQPIGLIAVLDGKPLDDERGISNLLQLVAIRAAAELERERSERMLQEREREFHLLAESMPDNLVCYDLQCRVKYMNRAMATSVASEIVPVLGRSPAEAFPDKEAFVEYQQMLAHVIASGEGASVEVLVPDPQGEMRTHQIRHVAKRNEAGEIVGLLAIGRDITKRKMMEDELRVRESESRRQAMFQHSLLSGMLEAGVILVVVENGHFVYTNDRYVGCQLGYAKGQLPETVGFIDLIHPDDRQRILQMHRDRLAGKAVPTSYEIGVLAGDGSRLEYEFHVTLVPDTDPPQTLLLALNIGARKRTEMALQRREREFRTLAENMPDILIRYDRAGHRTYINPALIRNYAVMPEQMIGLRQQESNPFNMPESYRRALEHTLATGERGEIELQIPTMSGELRTNLVFIAAERTADGQISGAITIGHDITERKQMENERQDHAYSLECLDRINQAIQGATDLDQMMRDVHDVVLSIFGCDRVFFVYPCDPEADEWTVPMERTRPEYPGALASGVGSLPMDNDTAQAMHMLLNAPGPVQFGPDTGNSCPAQVSEQFGFKSQMLMVIRPKLDKPWVFGIHQCTHANVWPEKNAVLFQKIGWRLSDALTGMLMYRDLCASEQKFRSLAENLPDILIRYDKEGRRTYVNPAMASIFGGPDTQLIGMTQQQANPLGLPESYRQALAHTLATGERSEFEMSIPLVSGELRVGSVFIAAERSEDGQITGAISLGRDITKLKQAELQLRELTAHLQIVREEEKAHLAREIHDDLASTLAALNWKLRCVLDFEFPADMKKMPLHESLESMSPMLKNAIAATRRIITNMRPDVLDNLGLLAALKWQADQFHGHTGIACQIVCANEQGCEGCTGCEYPLDKTLSINLFRIFQESLANVVKHSGATKVAAEYRVQNGEVFLAIRDNGRGLPEEFSAASTSFGIRGMRERIGQLGGEIEFDSPSGGGFCVRVKVPLLLSTEAGGKSVVRV